MKQDTLISWPVPAGLVLLLVVGVHKTNSQPPCLVGEFLFVIYHRRELFQIKSLTWLLDRTLLVGDSKDTANKEVVFDLPTSRVYDLCQRAKIRQQEIDRERILALDLDPETHTFSRSGCIVKSIRSKLTSSIRTTVDPRVWQIWCVGPLVRPSQFELMTLCVGHLVVARSVFSGKNPFRMLRFLYQIAGSS